MITIPLVPGFIDVNILKTQYTLGNQPIARFIFQYWIRPSVISAPKNAIPSKNGLPLENYLPNCPNHYRKCLTTIGEHWHHLVDLYHVCSNNAPGAKSGPALGVTCFTWVNLYRENITNYSCLEPQGLEL